jgi:MFS family permease
VGTVHVRRRRAPLPRDFWLLFAALLANRLGAFVLPYLALYLTIDRGFSPAAAGSLVASYGAGAIVASLLGGRLADGWGRKRTMVLSFTGSASCALTLAVADRPTTVVAAVAGIGVLGEMFRPAALAAVADVVPPDERTRAYGHLYWATNLGFAAAMVLGGFVATRSFTTAFLLDATTSLVAAVLVAGWLAETRPSRTTNRADRPGRLLPRDPVLLVFVALAFAFFWVYNQAAVTLPLALRAEGLPLERYGLVMAVNGITVVLLQVPVTRVVERMPRRVALAVGAATMGGGFGVYAVVGSLWAMMLAVVVWTLGEIVYSVTAPTVLADLAPDDMRGRYQGLFAASLTAASVAGPLGGGLLLQVGGPDTVWLVCAVTGAVTALGYLTLRTERPHSRATR